MVDQVDGVNFHANSFANMTPQQLETIFSEDLLWSNQNKQLKRETFIRTESAARIQGRDDLQSTFDKLRATDPDLKGLKAVEGGITESPGSVSYSQKAKSGTIGYRDIDAHAGNYTVEMVGNDGQPVPVAFSPNNAAQVMNDPAGHPRAYPILKEKYGFLEMPGSDGQKQWVQTKFPEGDSPEAVAAGQSAIAPEVANFHKRSGGLAMYGGTFDSGVGEMLDLIVGMHGTNAAAGVAAVGLSPVTAGLGIGMASPINYVKNIGGGAIYGVGATVAQLAGFEGAAFSMRSIQRSYVEDFKDASMISMINNRAIPIEDMIFLFMAYMNDKYETKLREKMEEAAIAEKKERWREREKREADLLSAPLGLIPGVGPIAQSVVQAYTQEKIRIHDSLDGTTKSSTMLMSEVQVLLNKWKNLHEAMANLIKALHDMARVPIRHLA